MGESNETILDRLCAHARERTEAAKRICSLEEMKEMAIAAASVTPKEKRFLFERQLAKPGIHFICECKKASPSKGLIAPDFPYLSIAKEYEAAGAAAISCLTEPKWFLGKNEYLEEIARNVSIPVLRKDFTVDPYMIYEAKVLGAGAVLLICAVLPEETIREYIGISDSLGMSALVEAHDEEEVRMAARAGARIIGVNNRNLKDFTVDVRNSIRLRGYAPEGTLFVAESGIRIAEDVRILAENGVNGVLIGETLMRAKDKKAAMQAMVPSLVPGTINKVLTESESVNENLMVPGTVKSAMKVKICGLRRPEDADIVNEVRPDYAGFIFAPDRKRYIPPEKAEKIRKRLDPSIRSVGVFVNAKQEEILRTLETVHLDAVQLHGQETEEYIGSLRQAMEEASAAQAPLIIKAFRICTEHDVRMAEASSADLILLDNGAGGTGESFDWNLLRDIKRDFLLAGGISAGNAEEAVRKAAPWGLDVSSSLETDGCKDPEKIRKFMEVIRRI